MVLLEIRRKQSDLILEHAYTPLMYKWILRLMVHCLDFYNYHCGTHAITNINLYHDQYFQEHTKRGVY